MPLFLDILLIGLAVLAGLTAFGPRRDAGGWQPPAAAATRASAPLRLGHYTLDSKIGEGAMGEVYRAWNSTVGAWHAVKLLPRHASPHERRRFEQEARLGALVRHPNTVSILEQAEERHGTCYYAMELLEGTSLQELVEREGPQPPARVSRILGQIAAALEELHVQGLVHRDIKPQNVLLTGAERDVCKLIDFGLVEHVAALAEGQPQGALIGTPLYISPEAVVAPETVGPWSDLYGLGALGYFLLRGEPVFQGSSLLEVCCHHVHSKPAPLTLETGDAGAGASAGAGGGASAGAGGGAVDAGAAELERVVLACLAKNPCDRPATAAEVARRLNRCNAASRPSARVALARSCQAAETCSPARPATCPIAARGGLSTIAESQNAIWFDAHDGATEGTWRWGPSGPIFWVGHATGSARDGAYASWATGKPNDNGGEHCAVMHVGSGADPLGTWNDETCDGLHSPVRSPRPVARPDRAQIGATSC